MNSFVSYLDQFNVQSPNHSKIYDEYSDSTSKYNFKINTQIEEYLLHIFKNSPKSVIMTGNAGDGKTRLCRTVYESILNERLIQWPESGIVDVPYEKGTIRIVKDLSELKEDVIYHELSQLQSYVQQQHSEKVYYLIAANEGKLTKFLSQEDSLKELYHQISNRFLSNKNNDDNLYLVNLQDVTSSLYASRILNEWNKEEYWADCQACTKQKQCTIYFNHRKLSNELIQKRCVEQYQLLDSLGIHITMREILIHLSYVITGGLTCSDILKSTYKQIDELASHVYYENFYGLKMSVTNSGELSAIHHLKPHDPGVFSISMIDDFILNGDISGDVGVVEEHNQLFHDDIDMLNGLYRRQIELYRNHNPNIDQSFIFENMPRFRRKYFFEINESYAEMRKRLLPYQYFFRFREVLSNKQLHGQTRKELIHGINCAFSKRLVSKAESQLYAMNENLLIHQAFSLGQVKIIEDSKREDIDYEPSKFVLQVEQTKLEIKLPVFEYLMRLSCGGLFVTLKQEVEILINTFKNEMIKNSELEDFELNVLALDPQRGVYSPRTINID